MKVKRLIFYIATLSIVLQLQTKRSNFKAIKFGNGLIDFLNIPQNEWTENGDRVSIKEFIPDDVKEISINNSFDREEFDVEEDPLDQSDDELEKNVKDVEEQIFVEKNQKIFSLKSFFCLFNF